MNGNEDLTTSTSTNTVISVRFMDYIGRTIGIALLELLLTQTPM